MTPIADIEAFVKEIVLGYAPEKVILFGSYAYGSPTPDSDVDLMVIMDHASRNVELASEITSSSRRTFPLDLFVRRPSDIKSRLNMGDPFIREVIEQGKIIYEAVSSRVGRES